MAHENSGRGNAGDASSAPSNSHRLFFGVLPDEHMKDALGDVQDRVSELARLRFGPEIARKLLRRIPAGNLHVTLHFLGEVPTSAFASLCGLLSEDQLDRDEPSAVQAGPLSQLPIPVTRVAPSPMPGIARPRAIVCDVTDPGASDALGRMHAHLARGLLDAGYPVEKRRYRPHVTLFYIRRTTRTRSLSDELAEFFDDIAGLEAPVAEEQAALSEVRLIESVLKPSGAEYRSLCG